ncbi:hypothetical protein [Terricaulis silvestris]|uniref:Uncharacterized protein n=1 Tax=Terricaulis silvestris TaxID=2686094 RepID=A0A6I6MK70_9CAUL|nr:hypothetical protein [Terricaulis silvestris]QGZ95630.1 hypothetical protein DSM104635_02480 [Terricaulis silvestris]
MPIVLRHNESLELSRTEYFGAMTAQDLHDHAAFNAASPIWLGFDCISVIHAGIDVSEISLGKLDGVFNAHRQLFEPLGLMFVRRSGWVCESPAGQRFLSHWLAKRNVDRSPWADVRQFDSFEAASEWLLLDATGSAALKSGEGFREVARFETASAQGLAR